MVAMFTNNFNAFRFYDDSGGEAASAQLAAQDVNITVNLDGGDVDIQFRARVDEVGGADGTTMDDYGVEVDKNATSFVALPTSDTGTGIFAVAAGLTNDAATTNRSSDPISDPGGGAFVAGEQSDDGIVDDMQITASDFTEHAYGLRLVAADLVDGDFFDLQFSNSSVSNNNVTPRITIEKSGALTQDVGGVLSFSGGLVRETRISPDGTLSFTGGLIRQTQISPDGVLSFGGSLATSLVALKNVAGVLSFAGALIKQARISPGGSLSFSGDIVRQTNKNVAGSLAFNGLIVRLVNKNLDGTLSFTGTVIASVLFSQVVIGVLDFVGGLATLFIPGNAGPGIRRMWRSVWSRV